MHKIENWNRQYDSIIHIGKDGTIKEDLVIKPNEKVVIQEDNKRNLTYNDRKKESRKIRK